MTRYFKHQNGISMIEISLALGIVAVSCALLLQYVHRQTQRDATTRSQDFMQRAQKSLLGYVQIYGRFPCPAQDMDGKESCNGVQEGYFPFMTVGLPERKISALRYRLEDPAALTSPQPLYGLLPQIDAKKGVHAESAEVVGGSRIALCQVLSQRKRMATTAVELRPQPSIFGTDFLSTSGSVLSYGQVLNRLHCQGHLMAAARAHPNAILASHTLGQALKDYHQGRSFMRIMIAGDVVGFSYEVLNSLLTLRRTVPMIHNAWSMYYMKEGLDNTIWSLVNSYITVSADVINSARQVNLVTRASIIYAANQRLLSQVEELMTRLGDLQSDIRLRATSSAFSGFLWTQVAPAKL